jgi:hypothetical protein
MSRSHQLAWAAGFIDGDGFITIQDRTSTVKGKTYNGFYVRLGCCQASEVPLKELQKLFGGTIRIKNSGPNRENYNRKTQYIWCLSTKEAAQAIEQLLPYLVHKKEVARLAIEFQNTMGNYYKVPEEVVLYRTLLKDKIQTINSLS